MLMSLLMLCDSYRIQTCNLLIRSQMLYSVELRSRLFFFCDAKLGTFLILCKFFDNFFQKNRIFWKGAFLA